MPAQPMTVTLTTVLDVPIVSTGTYQLASGETTFSAEDLADAVMAAQDPTVPAPRLKLGHTDPRFDEAIAAGELDGEPAFGTVQNLRLSDDGQTVIGDYCDVPDWLAEMLPSSYPGRSIEGGFGYTAPSGRSYKLVIARVALLGITWPGVTSLADLREVLEQNGQADADLQPVEAASDRFVLARIARPSENQLPGDAPRANDRTRQLLAGMDLGSIRNQFFADLDDGEVPRIPDGQPRADDVGPQVWWWARSVRVEDDGSLCLIVDDDEGNLIRIPFTVKQGDLLYGQPELVLEQYVPVTSDPDEVTAGARTLASWQVRAATRPSNPTEVHTMRINGSDVDAAALRQRLGLADDADETAIYNALGITPEPTPTTEPDETPAATPALPEGMAVIDQEALAQLQQNAEQGALVAARIAREDRDRIINAAIQAGKLPVSRRGHYETMWARDEEGARALLTASVQDGGLAPGLVPVARSEQGYTGDGELLAGGDQFDEYFARSFRNEHNRLTAKNGRLRVRQEA